jgi:hypothetical protein
MIFLPNRSTKGSRWLVSISRMTDMSRTAWKSNVTDQADQTRLISFGIIVAIIIKIIDGIVSFDSEEWKDKCNRLIFNSGQKLDEEQRFKSTKCLHHRWWS